MKIIAVSGSEPLEGKTGKGAGKSAPGWKKTQKNIGQKRNKPDYFENQVWGDEKVLKYSTFLVGYEQVPKPEQRYQSIN